MPARIVNGKLVLAEPWWGARALADSERERLARQQDLIEAKQFQAKIDAALMREQHEARAPHAPGCRSGNCGGECLR